MDKNCIKFKVKNETKNQEMIANNDKTIETNDKTVIDGSEDFNDWTLSAEEVEDIESNTKRGNECKVCTDEDLSTHFFASGPFYAIDSSDEQMTDNIIKRSDGLDRRERSDNCNVLYAEMPEEFDEDITKSTNNIRISSQMDAICCTDRSTHTNGLDNDSGVGHNDPNRHNYQFVCYNCCSPLSVTEVSQTDHKLYYISNDDSNVGSDGRLNGEHRSSHSPIVWKFCRKTVENIDNNPSTCRERMSSYTTVIKPKAVRPLLTPITSQMSGQLSPNSFRSTLPTLSFHGSVNVLTDRDDSAFTQIPRRRSNSEATHQYQSIANSESECRTPSTRPVLRHQRSKSVNKSYNSFDNTLVYTKCQAISDKYLTRNEDNISNDLYLSSDNNSKQRNSTQSDCNSEPIHMTLEEVKHIFTKNQTKRLKNTFVVQKCKRNSNECEDRNGLSKPKPKSKIKSAIESMFRNKRKSGSPVPSSDEFSTNSEANDRTEFKDTNNSLTDSSSPFTYRALPPLPNNNTNGPVITTANNHNNNNVMKTTKHSTDNRDAEHQKFLDYAASIERVKDCGWYWGPISGEMAEKLLASEPCGSFIVRDSSDEHYIFSLTFKLNGLVRHVRIEHDQGNFSFGSLQKFRSNTIVDFIENAVQHSRSGRFLFFLHRRPVMGPMRVQLLHPVSRFKQIQSLQHICRFIILKHVRRDLIDELPLPTMLKTYLNTPYYYSEELALMSKEEPKPELNQSLPQNSSHLSVV